MTTKKMLKKQLMAAVALVLLSAITLTGSTYAWFSINTEASVSGLKLNVKSDSIYLLVSKTNSTASAIQAEGLTSVSFNTTNELATVKPSAHNPTTGTAVVGTDLITSTTAATNPANWYYKNADAPTASTSTSAATALSSSNFSDYVLHYTIWFTLAIGSNPAADLTVSATFASLGTYTGDESDSTFQAARVLVTSPTQAVELDPSTTSSATVLASTLTSTTVVQVDIFIYYDGNDSSVYTNNSMNLDGCTIDLDYEVQPVA